ncbi:uncharacterized protein LY89DRAFT_679574 [Mollisia scopiformis]|uniref:Terpene cyclase n=1 Tax=Mollisia scopiformis TaxID=149040 RepID=A0A194XVT8_MOLSC|nr:uncharacterized protein LY89DRAFT_679574 [Mollisia scopiformis]KUJ24430.1 hypothetical protein LY89DRAFT_679574 [Mollisia scopiformis]
MGSNDISPPHVPSYVVPVSNALLQAGGGLWTITYILMARQSFKDRTYGMPFFALALNFAWEIVYALYVAEMPLERFVFTVWLLLDCAMVYGLLTSGKEEWNHAPSMKKYLGTIFWITTIWCTVGHWAFAKWWLDNDVGQKEGKFYMGRVGPDTTELGFWSALICQVNLSAASLVMLLVRQHTGGVSWKIWGSRMLGSVFGLYGNYGWEWWMWREAHEYFMSPFAVFMWVTCLVCDLVYPFFFARIRRTEKVLLDGRKAPGSIEIEGKKSR